MPIKVALQSSTVLVVLVGDVKEVSFVGTSEVASRILVPLSDANADVDHYIRSNLKIIAP